ncbi:hypothetical protein ACJD0Z_09675 [Flavobacteriaceae bacterium M23B6Z8]
MKNNKLQWLLRGGVGSALVGFGLCATMESGLLKYEHPDSYLWIIAGTASLIVFMAGINILIGSLEYKIKMNIHKKEKA